MKFPNDSSLLRSTFSYLICAAEICGTLVINYVNINMVDDYYCSVSCNIMYTSKNLIQVKES